MTLSRAAHQLMARSAGSVAQATARSIVTRSLALVSTKPMKTAGNFWVRWSS
jgi:hypothetical protein